MNEIQPSAIEEPEVERVPRPPDTGRKRLSPRRRAAAFTIAIAADAIQWIAFPLFAWGAASPVNDALDVIIAAVMVRLIGFHWAFLPTLIAEMVPFVDLVPSWTLAVWIASRGRR